MKIPSTRTLGLGLMAASLLPLSNSARLYTAQDAFMQNSVAKRAIVVAQQPTPRVPGKKKTNEMQSVVEYTDDAGSRLRGPTNVSSYPAPFAVGEEIDIRISLQNPSDIRAASFTGMWFETTFYLIPGLIALAGGALMVMRGRKR